MMESNTQGHGTIKKLRTGAVISTLAISALGVSTTVSASETEVVPKVPSQSDVEKAKAESDRANQDVAKQKEVVASTETKIANTEKTIADTTKKMEEVESVTPEKVAEAKEDAEKKASELATAEKNVADADKSVSATAEKVEDQTKVVSNAEKTATDTANKVSDAQKKVDSLSSTTDTTQLEKEVATLTNQVKTDTQAVATAQTNLDNGKKAQSNKDKAVTTAQADLEHAKEELADATEGKARFTVSQEYVSLLKEYAKSQNASVSDQLKALGKKEMEKRGYLGDTENNPNRFKANSKDRNVKVDVANLTPEVEREINLFTADLINQIRDAFGTPRAIVTEDSMRIAREVAKESKEQEDHDFKALESVEAKNGVLIPENLGFSGTHVSNLAELKEVIYENVATGAFLDSDSDSRFNWAHALSFARLDNTKPNVVYQQYIGVGIQPTKRGHFNIHIDGTSDISIKPTSKFDKTKVVTADNNIKALQEKLDLAQSTYDNALKASQEAKSAVQSAQTDYTNVETALANARTHLSDLLGDKIDVPALEKALADAQSKLAEDTKALQTAKESLALAKSNATDKAKALADAKIALETAKAEQSDADKALATAKGELEVLTKAHDVAVLARKSAGEDLARKREASKEATDAYTVLELALTKRDEVLKALDKELTDANAKLGVLRAELETAKEELTRLKGIAEAKARGYENFKQLKADHDAYLAEQQRLQALKDKADAIRKAGGQPKEVTDATGKVVDVVDGKAQNKPVVATVGTKDDKTYQAPAQAINAKAEPKKQLPNTGEKRTNTATLAIITALSSIGLVYRKRKKSQ